MSAFINFKLIKVGIFEEWYVYINLIIIDWL